MRKNEARSVIIVDDEKMILSMLESHFLKDGYRCSAAISAEEALELIRQRPFDVLVTDIHMPRMDGLSLMQEAKKIRPDMVVIVMTGFADRFSYDAAVEAGASDFLRKPFTYKELDARIRQAQMPRQMSEMVLIDELTGLYNRRGFFSVGEHVINIERRQKHGLFLLCIDLENLKEINRAYGHDEGDEALREIGNLLRVTYRGSDVIARIGGDEFAVMPVLGDEHSGVIIIDRLNKAVSTHNEAVRKPYRLSVHSGLAAIGSAEACSLGDLLTEAERVMFQNIALKRSLPGAS